MGEVWQEAADGSWEESIPLPFYGSTFSGQPWFGCVKCTHRLGSPEEYEDHYRRLHFTQVKK